MRSNRERARNALNQRRWYQRQKASNFGFEGYVYAIITDINSETYVGATTNSLIKRLQQHRAGGNCVTSKVAHEISELILLEEVLLGEDLEEAEKKWIAFIKPSINIAFNREKKVNKNCYKGGITCREVWYPTRKALWEALGRVPYGTFKTRLHRGKDLEVSLGIK